MRRIEMMVLTGVACLALSLTASEPGQKPDQDETNQDTSTQAQSSSSSSASEAEAEQEPELVIVRNPMATVKEKQTTGDAQAVVTENGRVFIVDEQSEQEKPLRDAWSRFRALNGPGVVIYDPKNGLGEIRTPRRADPNAKAPQGRFMSPPRGTPVGPMRGGYSYDSRDFPRLSLPIGLPSLNIVHVPGFTYTSDPVIEYRTIGVPIPGLGPGNLVPAKRWKNP